MFDVISKSDMVVLLISDAAQVTSRCRRRLPALLLLHAEQSGRFGLRPATASAGRTDC